MMTDTGVFKIIEDWKNIFGIFLEYLEYFGIFLEYLEYFWNIFGKKAMMTDTGVGVFKIIEDRKIAFNAFEYEFTTVTVTVTGTRQPLKRRKLTLKYFKNASMCIGVTSITVHFHVQRKRK